MTLKSHLVSLFKTTRRRPRDRCSCAFASSGESLSRPCVRRQSVSATGLGGDESSDTAGPSRDPQEFQPSFSNTGGVFQLPHTVLTQRPLRTRERVHDLSHVDNDRVRTIPLDKSTKVSCVLICHCLPLATRHEQYKSSCTVDT